MDVDSAASRISQAETAASRAEREAQERIARSRKRVQEADVEAQRQIDSQRDLYEKRGETERSKAEDILDRERAKGYEAIRETRRNQQSELSRVGRDGERTLEKTKGHYDAATYEAERRGEKTLEDLRKKQFAIQEYERRTGDDRVTELKALQQQQMLALQANRADTFEVLSKAAQGQKNEMEKKTRDAIQDSHEHYEELYAQTSKDQKLQMADLAWRTNREIENVRRDHARKLDAYASRSNDPFYQLVHLGANLSESDGAYTITARIPEHEQEHLNVTMRGNEVVISGQRRSEETQKAENGTTQRTSSYQSYSESVPLAWPVDSKLIQKEFDGDRLVITLPKKRLAEPGPYQKKASNFAKAAAERPQFPKNLPTSERLAALDAERKAAERELPPSQRSRKGGEPAG